jgi:tRNA(His) 5'-end guanylyltransferase
MRAHEAAFRGTPAPADLPVLIRLDGVRFSRLTRSFARPFDQALGEAMIRTAADLALRFPCAFAYTESDEITLVFAPVLVPEGGGAGSGQDGDDAPASLVSRPRMFGGRLQKTVTVVASTATARFNVHLRRIAQEEEEDGRRDGGGSGDSGDSDSDGGSAAAALRRDAMRSGEALFDARLFVLPDERSVLQNLRWRMMDCRRNSVSQFFKHLALGSSGGRMDGLAVPTMLRRLQQEHSLDYFAETMPHYRFGSVVKKKLVQVEAYNPKRREAVSVGRRVVCHTPADFLWPEFCAHHPRVSAKGVVSPSKADLALVKALCSHSAIGQSGVGPVPSVPAITESAVEAHRATETRWTREAVKALNSSASLASDDLHARLVPFEQPPPMNMAKRS